MSISNSRRPLARIAVAALAIGLAAAAPAPRAQAQERAATGPFGGNITGSLGFVSDYMFRGISQTDNDMALQGALEFALPVVPDVEAYIGAWGSNVDFNSVGAGSLELDWLAGLRGTVMEKLGYDVNAVYYTYPGSQRALDYDNWDIGASLSYDFGVATPYIGARYSPNFFGDSGHAAYYNIGVSVPVPGLEKYSVALMGEIGRQNIEKNAVYGTPDYTNYILGISASAYTLDVSLQYSDTNMSRAECASGSNTCDARVVLGVSKSF